MQIKVTPKTFFVFDLDDTLFSELEFLKSGYRYIAAELKAETDTDIYEEMFGRYQAKENVFDWLLNTYSEDYPELSKESLLKKYREHEPSIKLTDINLSFLNKVGILGIPCGLITDGRSITQRNKLAALGIADIFKEIIISEEFGSEKPHPNNFDHFEANYPGSEFYFFGDNTAKDFVVPAKLGWITVCLKNAGENIHEQDFTRQPVPDYIIDSFSEITLVKG